MFNLTEYCLHKNSKDHSNKIALIFVQEDKSKNFLTYMDLYSRIISLAHLLKDENLPKSSRVLIRLENSLEYTILFFASIAAGLVPVPLSPRLTKVEVDFIINDSSPSLIFYSKKLELSESVIQKYKVYDLDFIKNIKSVQQEFTYQTEAEDPAFLIYTSGTLGVPKGVLHAQRNILGRIPMKEGWTNIQEDDRLLHAGQMNWTYTIGVGLMDVWTNKATSILYNGVANPETWTELMEKEKATIFVAVPSLYRRILKYVNFKDYDLSKLKYGLTAGEALPSKIREQWSSETKTELYEALGMSEISTYISSSPNVKVKSGSPGKVQKQRQVRIISLIEGVGELPSGEIGLIAVHKSDPGLMLTYWNRAEEMKAVFRGDWFIGGDIAHKDEDGYIFFHGRNNELMNSFGYRVSPIEVEHVLLHHPEVHEAGVAEIWKSEDMSIIVAFIELKNPEKASQELKLDILHFAMEHLADYKLPRDIIFVQTLPRNANGKLLRKELVFIDS